MKTKPSLVLWIMIPVLFLIPLSIQAQNVSKHRLIVLTDIEADPDDSQTLVRLLLYSNVIDIEGLVATTSTHQRTRVAPETIQKIVDAYGKVQPNLLKHEKGFPGADVLSSLIKTGLPVYGMEGVGQGKDSEGSEWIIRVLEKDDDRPVWVSVWGGPNTLAQALWKIRETKSKREAGRLISKLRVYTISDQDDSGPWMRREFPDLFYIVSPGANYGSATWIAINQSFPGTNNDLISNKWITDYIQQGHGPLGAQYPDVAYGMEGDTPSWLSLIPTGLNPFWDDHPDYGGWGGRYELYLPKAPAKNPNSPFQRMDSTEPETRPIWTNAVDTLRTRRRPFSRIQVRDTVASNHYTLWRWREDFQNDFAARMDWCVMSYEEANHPPVAVVNGPEQFTVKSGEIFKLDADGTYDPDVDGLSYLWFQYPEAGTYPQIVSFGSLADNLYNVHTIVAPKVSSPQTAHFILKVTDKGTPALSRYKRVIVTIEP